MRLKVQISAAERAKRETKSDAVLTALRGATPAQIEAFIDTQVTDLAGAKRVLKALAKAIVLLTQRTPL